MLMFIFYSNFIATINSTILNFQYSANDYSDAYLDNVVVEKP